MRVLFTTRGSSGHVGPMVPFARAAVAAGHKVAVAAQRQFGGNVTRAGLEHLPFDEPPQEEWMPLMNSFAELDLATSNDVMIRDFFGGLDVRASLPGLEAIVAEWRPDLIVRESWEFASALVAELNGIPMARIGLGLSRLESEAVGLVAAGLEGPAAALGLPADPAGDRLVRPPLLTTMPEALDEPAGGDGAARRFRFESSPPGEPPAYRDPGDARPLVYMTFGSVAAAGHLPYYPDLYRAAIDAIAPLPVRLLVTVGDDSRDLEELGELPGNVHAETWVPQDDVLGDAAVVVCHGGYGSMLGALARARPLVVLPLFSSDQWANADAVVRAGAGMSVQDDAGERPVLALPADDLVAGLGRAVSSVLEDARYARMAERIADEIAELPPIEESVPLLESIASAQ